MRQQRAAGGHAAVRGGVMPREIACDQGQAGGVVSARTHPPAVSRARDPADGVDRDAARFRGAARRREAAQGSRAGQGTAGHGAGWAGIQATRALRRVATECAAGLRSHGAKGGASGRRAQKGPGWWARRQC